MLILSRTLPLVLLTLGASLVGSSPAPLGGTLENADGYNTCQKTKVLILGAGITGIAAAQALHNRTIEDFVILEYNAEIGGRAKHVPFGKGENGQPYTIELGANWVQGTVSPGGPENPIWTLAKRYHISNTYSNYSSIRTFDSHGAKDFTDLLAEYEDKYLAVEASAGETLLDNLQDQNMRAAFSLAGWTPQTDALRQAAEWWSWDFESAQSPEASSHLYGIAGYNATFYRFSEINNFVVDPRGFSTFISSLASSFLRTSNTTSKRIIDPRLKLSTKVTTIAYNNASTTVHTANGSCYTAEYTLTTFSLGVLQSSISADPATPVRFDPALPNWKQRAINTWDIGTYTKIFFQFDSKASFWTDIADTQFLLYADPTTRGYWPLWQSLNLEGFYPESGIIFCTVTAEQSARLEALDDTAVKNEGLAVLRAMFPLHKIPEPKDFTFPRWGKTEWALGSYSNWPTGVSLAQHQNLRSNVGRVWFAGEAGSAEYYGFLQGGYFEGGRAGSGIADCLSNGGGGRGAQCGEERYERLMGTTPLSSYVGANGWYDSTFETYGLEGGGS